ncbi:rhodanese-like domain-containing protein [Sulfurimonas sp.]|uniref:rhodanese-like domain-containing protein n=1 Tax=Sulfurimonas sp. TaxID=2022749 RepID=UPI0025E92299|nr:rhodanese-like domain-containing protein [Sulfurimonas sp.]
MRKILLSLMILSLTLFASMSNQYPSQKILDSKIPIVDIRTPGEWKETGLAKGAIPIMFFDEKGAYNVNAFLDELNKKVDTKKSFAIICRTGNRTKMVANFLSKDLGYDVINLQGGMVYFKASKLPIVPYKK